MRLDPTIIEDEETLKRYYICPECGKKVFIIDCKKEYYEDDFSGEEIYFTKYICPYCGEENFSGDEFDLVESVRRNKERGWI